MIGGESMKGKQLFASALCVLALAACNKKPEEVTTTQAPTTVQATTVAQTTVAQTEHATYFEMLQLAYNVAAKDADITEGLAAAKKVRDEMFEQYPSDKDDIDNAYSDLELLVRFNATGFSDFMKHWNASTGQQFEALHEAIHMDGATLDGEKIKWNMMGVVASNDYDVMVVEAYLDATKKEAFLFGYEDGEPLVLHATNVTRETLAKAAFQVVKDADLLRGFTDNATWKATAEASANQSIADAMAIYARKRGEIYERTSPATQREYYDLAVPDQLFKYATVDGEKANFKWGGLTFQSGGVPYEIVECYVSESGTTVIVFAKKEGINVLLIGESEPQTTKKADGTIKSSIVNLQPYENDTLERALW